MGSGASWVPAKAPEPVDASGEVKRALERPQHLAQMVKASWASIKAERPPLPEGADPTQMSYAVSVTFAEMFGFNMMVLSQGVFDYTGTAGIDMSWTADAMPAFGCLVQSVDDSEKFSLECGNFAKTTGASKATDKEMALFMTCSLASLRSCLPKMWSLDHEIAWAWFWERYSARRYVSLGETISDNMSVAATDSLVEVSKGIIIQGKALVDLVQSSYGKIPTEQPPCPEGENPMMQIPVTFIGMATFNTMIVTMPSYFDPKPLLAEDMTFVPDVLAAFENLVKTFGTDEFETQCASLGVTIKEKGATAAAAKDMVVIILCSMRSLMPNGWSTQLEVAWRTFWEIALPHICAKL